MDLFLCVRWIYFSCVILFQVLSIGSCTGKVNLMILQLLLRSSDKADMTDMDKSLSVFSYHSARGFRVYFPLFDMIFAIAQGRSLVQVQPKGGGLSVWLWNLSWPFNTNILHRDIEEEAKMMADWKCPGWRFVSAITVYRDTMHSKLMVSCGCILIFVMNGSG